jgi:hypothetical protein
MGRSIAGMREVMDGSVLYVRFFIALIMGSSRVRLMHRLGH